MVLKVTMLGQSEGWRCSVNPKIGCNLILFIKFTLKNSVLNTFVCYVIKYLIELNVFKLIKAKSLVVQSVHNANTSSEPVLNCCNIKRTLLSKTAPPAT